MAASQALETSGPGHRTEPKLFLLDDIVLFVCLLGGCCMSRVDQTFALWIVGVGSTYSHMLV